MKALILAAGLGSRLGDKTEDIPKALIQFNGEPILKYQIDALIENGIEDIVIVVGYKGGAIRDFLNNSKFKDLNVTFVENKDPQNTNSAYSLWLAREEIKDSRYIHLNCDIIFSTSVIKKVLDSKNENVIVVDYKVKLKDNMEQVILNGDKITKMRNTLLEGAVGKAAGVAKISPEAINWILGLANQHIQAGDKNRNAYGLLREAVEHLEFHIVDIGEDILYEVNTLEDLEKVKKVISDA